MRGHHSKGAEVQPEFPSKLVEQEDSGNDSRDLHHIHDAGKGEAQLVIQSQGLEERGAIVDQLRAKESSVRAQSSSTVEVTDAQR